MISRLKAWWKTYQTKRKIKQLKDIDKWCDYIVDSLVERQQIFDEGYYVKGCYKDLDNTLGKGLGTCIRVYHGVYASECQMNTYAKELLEGCILKAETKLGKSLNKELKEF